jgi:hypothetical protein
MAIATVARRLPHFPLGTAPGAAPRSDFRPLVDPPAAPTAPERMPSETDRAVAAALADAEQRFAEVRAVDEERHERGMAELENRLLRATAERLADGLKTATSAIDEAIGDHVARALLRFLDDGVRSRAVSELKATVSTLLAGSDAAKVRLTGPAALVERLREIAPSAIVEPVAGDVADVTVTIDDTVIETRIAAWIARLAAAAAETGNG